MRFRTFNFLSIRRRLLLLLIGIATALSFLIAGAGKAQQPVDSRPRTTGTATPTPQQPTPTPDPTTAEISEGDKLTINTELVTLHVRVIDRNNHPINNVQKEEFRILEDGVPQPIFSFTREEVPVMYGLAVDTSGSLRPAFDQVINAGKAIINSNKRGDETFLERFISSDKIETVQDFTSSKDALLDGLDTLYIEGGQTAVIDGVYLE